MARKQSGPSSAEKIDYLYSIGVSVASDATPATINRYYSKAKKLDEAGELAGLTPTEIRAELRGHSPRVKHITKKGKRSEQYRAKGTEKKPISSADIQSLYKKANPGGRRRGNISGSITGLIEYQDAAGLTQIVEKTYGFSVDAKSFETLMASGRDVLTIAREISRLPWIEVYSINVKSY